MFTVNKMKNFGYIKVYYCRQICPDVFELSVKNFSNGKAIGE